MATLTIAVQAKPVSLLEPGLLTVVIARDDRRFSARCLELDLITEMDTPEEALADLLSMMQEYAADYQRRRELFARSPNRAHHRPYMEAILRCRDEWELRELLTIRYAHIHLQPVSAGPAWLAIQTEAQPKA